MPPGAPECSQGLNPFILTHPCAELSTLVVSLVRLDLLGYKVSLSGLLLVKRYCILPILCPSPRLAPQHLVTKIPFPSFALLCKCHTLSFRRVKLGAWGIPLPPIDTST